MFRQPGCTYYVRHGSPRSTTWPERGAGKFAADGCPRELSAFRDRQDGSFLPGLREGVSLVSRLRPVVADPSENVHDRRVLPLLQDGGPVGIELDPDLDPGREVVICLGGDVEILVEVSRLVPVTQRLVIPHAKPPS
jgi:hypothetical protein